MDGFPRTVVGGVSVPRLICGSNWMLGYSHTSVAKDRFIRELFDTPQKAAKVIEVFARNGCNAFLSPLNEFVCEALREVEQRTGTEMLWFATPSVESDEHTLDNWKTAVEETKRLGAQFCFPHQVVTDPQLNRDKSCFSPLLTDLLKCVREAGLIPGLSSHTPYSIICSDNSEDDLVDSYIQPFNAAGFLCELETEWIHEVIKNAKKPVLTIKPLAAGRLTPPTGLTFVWNMIRDCDMVSVGTMSTYEAEEIIELSLSILENRQSDIPLQTTRSKKAFVDKVK